MSGLKPITVNTPTADEAHIYAEDDASIYLSMFGGDGVSTNGQSCKATVLSNNKVRIADGIICVGGHFARIPYGDYIDCEIENGQSGKKRNDIIVARFETTGTGGIDTYTCEVKKGTAGTTAADPEIVQEDLYKAGKVRELPLYRVKIEGLSITAVEQLFTLRKTNEELEKELASLNSKTIQIIKNNDSQQIYDLCGGKIRVVSGSAVKNVRGTDYICLVDKDELNEIFGQSYSITRLSIATCNGDNEATNTRFLGAEIWQGHIYQYFAQKLSCSVRINYRIVYTYL
nr:MAG TPA: Receptor Binding Protein sandwich domain, phage receptor.75A [Caudoviricetes sp.]